MLSTLASHPLWRSLWGQRGAAFFCGILGAGSLAPLYILPLLFLSFCGVLWLTKTAGVRVSFWVGWWFGFGYFTAGLYWIAFALGVDLDRFAWMIPFSVFGLPALLAFFIAPVFALTSALNLEKGKRLFLFAALWTIFEWLRGHLFTGFPWNLIGYCWMDCGPLAQSLSLFGIYGLSFFTVLWASSPLLFPRFRVLGGICLTFVGLTLFGIGRLYVAQVEMVPNLTFRLVQPSIPQKLKWSKEHTEQNLKTILALTTATPNSSPDIYIWPESATPFFLANDYLRRLSLVHSLSLKGILLTGTTRGMHSAKGELQVWNTLIGIGKNGDVIGTYDKNHLVPFGEYVPFRSLLSGIVHKVTPGSIDYSPGSGLQTMKIQGIPSFSPLICYEIIFPGAVKSSKDPFPEWLLNITNDAWYGRTSGPYQHLDIARARAIEEGLPLIRVSNNGISAVIDPYGRILGKIGLDERGFLDVSLPKFIQGHTPYFYYGDKIFFLMLLLIFGFLGFGELFSRKRR